MGLGDVVKNYDFGGRDHSSQNGGGHRSVNFQDNNVLYPPSSLGSPLDVGYYHARYHDMADHWVEGFLSNFLQTPGWDSPRLVEQNYGLWTCLSSCHGCHATVVDSDKDGEAPAMMEHYEGTIDDHEARCGGH